MQHKLLQGLCTKNSQESCSKHFVSASELHDVLLFHALPHFRRYHITREVETIRGHLLPRQQHLYNGLTRPADYSVFAREWTHCLRASRWWHKNGLAHTDSVLARPTVIVVASAVLARDRHQDGQLDRHRDKKGRTR